MFWKELTTGIYPWDIHDEGIETILDNLQNEAGCNAAYMLSIMHHEKRPLWDNYYPHNPVRKYYQAEDSRAYFKPDPAAYKNSRIKPRTSDRDFLKGTDWLELFSKALRKRGMKPGAELSHTLLDKERAVGEFADCVQRDIYGQPLPRIGMFSGQILCWNNPDAVAFLSALGADLARYDLEMIQTCIWPFEAGDRAGHNLLGAFKGGCFCDHCGKAASELGFDWDHIKAKARYWADALTHRDLAGNEQRLLLERSMPSDTAILLECPELYQWLRMRCQSFANALGECKKAIHAVNPKIDFRFNTCMRPAELFSQDYGLIAPNVDSFRTMDYSEQTGDEAKVMEKGKWVLQIRRQVGDDVPIIGAIAPRFKATPDLIRKGIKQVALAGADGLSFGFYDGATMERLRAIRQGMQEAEVSLRD